MINYSFVGYDIVNDRIFFKGTPTPGTKDLFQGENLQTSVAADILFNYEDQENETIEDSTTISFLKSLLTDFSITATKSVDFRIEIEDLTSISNISIIAENLDKTKSYVNTGTVTFAKISQLIDILKPKPKWKTMGKCRNCLVVNFLSGSNNYNLEGSINGEHIGDYNFNQKRYEFDLIDYTNPSLPTITPYYIYWRPNITTSFTDYAGTSRSISNEHKWIAIPQADFPTNINTTSSFYHVQSMFSASCPYSTEVPNSTWYNFFGEKGFFRLSLAAPTSPILGPNDSKECPEYSPSPAGGWGFNCGGDGNCVGAPSGSVGTYATLAECEVSCSVESTGSFGFNCTPNGCVEGSAGNTGSFATLQECLDSNCNTPTILFPTTCSECVEGENTILNGDFSDGLNNWVIPPMPSPAGNITSAGQTLSAAPNTTFTGSTPNISSSLFAQQEGLFSEKCNYTVCLEAWNPVGECEIVVDVGGSTQYLISDMFTTPQAYTFTFQAGGDFPLTLYMAGSGRLNVDNVSVCLDYCPPGFEPPGESCIISASADCYVDIDYGCICPDGFIPDVNSPGNCIQSGSFTVPKLVTGIEVTAPLEGDHRWGPLKPSLYYNFRIGGDAGSVTGSTSPFQGNSRVYNTQFDFDILSASFWNENAWSEDSFMNQFMRNIGALPIGYYGGGNFINLATSGTYHVALAADDTFRVKVDDVTVVDLSQSPGNFSLYQKQQFNARTPLGPNANIPVQSAEDYDGNIIYLPTENSNLIDINLGAGNGYENTYGYRSFNIYPITMSAGCHKITIEGSDIGGTAAGFGGVIFNNTAQEIVDAESLDDLNDIFNTRDNLIFDLALTSSISASCPEGTIALGTGSCDLCVTSGSMSTPCGDCIECPHGILYNGYVVDEGGPTLLGRGTGGVVNTDSSGSWTIPDETAWETLITFLNDNTAPTQTNGALDVISGGKMKDYTRDLDASCWAFPNVGAQTDNNSSGWAGVAGGQRTPLGVFDELGFSGYWWSANSITPSSTTMKAIQLKYYSDDVFKETYTKNAGFSIRLVRPSQSGELNGDYIPDAYTGNNGLIYDGIVIGSQVWIDRNLTETLYNSGSAPILNQNDQGLWNLATNGSNDYRCFYNNDSSFTSSIVGNVDPQTNLCYQYPINYIYQECNNNNILIQTESGSSTALNSIQKSPIDGKCWKLIQSGSDNSSIAANIFYQGNYFSGSNHIYSDCDECNAIHTIYMSFETKNC